MSTRRHPLIPHGGIDFVEVLFQYEEIILLITNFTKQKVMNKTDLVKAVAATGISQEASKKAIDAAIAAVKDALVKGESVQLIGFGTFSVTEKPAREGVNPATGAKIQIAAKKVAKFKPGKELAEAVK